jgi:hypothetical protein
MSSLSCARPEALARVIGTPGEQKGPVFKITIGRSDFTMKEIGATINARMGLNTWAAFYGSDAEAVVAGDVAMLAGEITPVPEGAAIVRHRRGRDPPPHDGNESGCLLSPLLGKWSGAEAGNGRQGGSQPSRNGPATARH